MHHVVPGRKKKWIAIPIDWIQSTKYTTLLFGWLCIYIIFLFFCGQEKTIYFFLVFFYTRSRINEFGLFQCHQNQISKSQYWYVWHPKWYVTKFMFGYLFFFFVHFRLRNGRERSKREENTKKTRTNEITEKELKNYCYLIQLLFDIEFINCLADFIIYGFSSGWFRSKEEKKKQE